MYKIITFSFLLAGSLFASGISVAQAATATSTVNSLVTTATSNIGTSTATSTIFVDRVAVEKRVREYFADVPVMIEIARCESNFRQFTDGGAVLRGGSTGGMVGVFQFFEQIHSKAALAKEFDLNTLEGNLGYAREVYQQSGTSPWVSCVPITGAVTNAKDQLRIELLTKLVELLTELLKLKLAEK